MIKFIDQSVEPLGIAPSGEPEMLKLIELAGRTAYKSEDKITVDSAVKFVQQLKQAGHLSVLEHSNIVLRIPHGELIDIEFTPEKLIKFLSHRLPYHPLIWEAGGMYIAGNVRAWLETIQLLSSSPMEFIFPNAAAFLQSALNRFFPSLFHECDSKVPSRWVRLVEVEDQIDFLELPVYVFRIVCDRGISHEIVRHRVFSYTQESTRYVNYGGNGLTLIKPEYDLPYDSSEVASEVYEALLAKGHKPQIARDVLPNLLKTELVVSGRWFGWQHFINLRDSKAAHPRIQKIGRQIREYFEGLGLTP